MKRSNESLRAASLSCMVIALEKIHLILPSSVVIEVCLAGMLEICSPGTAPAQASNVQQTTLPIGYLAWNETKLPVYNFEKIQDVNFDAQCPMPYVLIVHSLDPATKCPTYGLQISKLPRMVKVGYSAMEVRESSLPAYIQAEIAFDGQAMFIPKLLEIEKHLTT
ncbi:MAG: hypothetical protein V4490_03390 [Pseudomonadota bacterium]